MNTTGSSFLFFWLGYKLETKRKKQHEIGVTLIRCEDVLPGFLSFTLPFNNPFSSTTIPQLFTQKFYFLLFIFAKQSRLVSKMAARNTSSAGALEACGPAHWNAIGRHPSVLFSHWIRGAVDLLGVLDSFRAQRLMVGVYGEVKGVPGCLEIVRLTIIK